MEKKIVLDYSDRTLICDGKNNEFEEIYPQKEKDLEDELIKVLQSQGYEYVDKFQEEDLEINLRRQLERLNAQRVPDFKFSDEEWRNFYRKYFCGLDNRGIEKKNKIIHGDGIKKSLTRDDGSEINIDLFEKDQIHKNHLQVINQFIDRANNKRYDVTILVNGLPLVHIELKNRGISLKEAFNQIEKYKLTSFSGLYEFVQIFVISNGDDTRYYSNTTEYRKEKNSFLFTSRWAYSKNEPIKNLIEFARTFLERRTILEIIAKYCVLDSEGELRVMRPYQITATERILNRIRMSISAKLDKPTETGGYIWHTTGSGKTLTSFKAAQLAQQIPEVKKVLFVVDRKDLDDQTSKEYKKFAGGSSEQTIDETQNTEKLREYLNDDAKRIIITTIQKLRRLLKSKAQINQDRFEKDRVVIIMDECHRTQTLSSHKLIGRFKKKNVFGFTGTPILNEKKSNSQPEKTEDIFGDELHKYSIVDAINDENVLPFLVDYAGDRNEDFKKLAFDSDQRIKKVVEYILKNFKRKTTPSTTGDIDHLQAKFNSIFATDEIELAIKYYKEFKTQLAQTGQDIKVAIIYSAYHDIKGAEEKESDEGNEPTLTKEHENFLYKEAVVDYQQKFKCEINKNFDKYRASISEKVKNREIDILIVVNMFLTGFDAPMLNTLWVDKRLKEHGLIQAFSRTNRIFDKTKPYGNIVCFRNIKQEVDDAITKFAGGKCAFVKGFEERSKEFSELEQYVIDNFPLEQPIKSVAKELDFVKKFKELMILTQTLSGDERFPSIRKLTSGERQKYRTTYLEIRDKYIQPINKRTNWNDCSPQEKEIIGSYDIELLRTDEVNLNYILNLLANYARKRNREEIKAIIMSHPVWRPQEHLIDGYMDEIDRGHNIEFMDYKVKKFLESIQNLVDEYGLQYEGTKEFFEKCIDEGRVFMGGVGTKEKMMPKMNLLDKWEEYISITNKVKKRAIEIFETFKDVKKW